MTQHIFTLPGLSHTELPCLFLIIVSSTNKKAAVCIPIFNPVLIHFDLFPHVLLPLCVWSLCDLVFFSFSLFPLIPSTISVICSVPFTSLWSFFGVWPPPPPPPPSYFLSIWFSSGLSSQFPPFSYLTPCSPSALCVSEPMVVCALHPPASHSAPSFLRQYASHLGRTALRREPGGGPERDRAFLNLHRTGSLGTNTLTLHRKHAHTYKSGAKKQNDVLKWSNLCNSCVITLRNKANPETLLK